LNCKLKVLGKEGCPGHARGDPLIFNEILRFAQENEGRAQGIKQRAGYRGKEDSKQ